MRKNKQGMSVGVVSLIMIFVVFLLVSLAVLSLTTASANARMADKSLAMQSAYYEADARAQETLAQVDGVLKRELRCEGNRVLVARWQTVTDGEWQTDSDTKNLWKGGAS